VPEVGEVGAAAGEDEAGRRCELIEQQAQHKIVRQDVDSEVHPKAVGGGAIGGRHLDASVAEETRNGGRSPVPSRRGGSRPPPTVYQTATTGHIEPSRHSRCRSER